MRGVFLGLLLAAGPLGAQQTLVRAREPEGYLGITFICPLKRIEDANGVRVIHLAYPAIESVDPGSPAADGGISAGDTILAYDSVDVLNHEMSLTRLLRPGNRVLIRVRRNGAVKEVGVRVAVRPASYGESVDAWPPGAPPPFALMPHVIGTMQGPIVTMPSFEGASAAGASVVRTNEDLRAALGAPKGEGGVLVLNVAEGTPAEASGLHSGDLVLSADGRSISDPAAFAVRLAEPTTRSVTLRVYGNHKIRTVTLLLDAAGR
jgi:S1-C subfamily serine protease